MNKFVICLFLILSTTLHAQVRQLAVESNHSTVGFRISIAGFTEVSGTFGEYSIDLDWHDDDYAQSSIDAVIHVNSINTGIKSRDEHLQSADFFDIENFPVISFKSDSIQKVDFSNFRACGELNLHGVQKTICIPFQIRKMDGNTIGFRSRYILNRIDFEIASDFQHTSMPDFLAKEIMIEIDFWTKKRKQK